MPRRSFLDLSVPSRGLFVALFLALELLAIAWGLRAPDHVLGFQMFNESSSISVQLFREVERKRKRVLLPVPDGTWQVRDAAGNEQRYAWQARIKYRPLSALGAQVPAKYGVDAQLFRLQAALDDMARHIPDDRRTKALVAVVETTKNGGPAQTIQLRAERR